MSVNKYKPHIILVPEDKATHRIATSFTTEMIATDPRWHVIEYQDGWPNVFAYLKQQVPTQQAKSHRIVIAIIDFDGQAEQRRADLFGQIPESLHERVFLFGCRDEAEDLRRVHSKSLSEIGILMNKACLQGDFTHWENEQLAVNGHELIRLRDYLETRQFVISRP
jgi:phosphoribosylformimino-5-aminoimidazole carboxamide ribonucleotide (ProFAR) isomerase